MPPVAGTVHSTPSKSMTSVFPSGDNAAAMFVPSWIERATLIVSEGSTEIAPANKIRTAYVNVFMVSKVQSSGRKPNANGSMGQMSYRKRDLYHIWHLAH